MVSKYHTLFVGHDRQTDHYTHHHTDRPGLGRITLDLTSCLSRDGVNLIPTLGIPLGEVALGTQYQSGIEDYPVIIVSLCMGYGSKAVP